MKRIDELGISPWPWTKHEWCQPDDIGSEVRDATGRPIIDTFDLSFYPQSHANCRFVAASPDLYRALLKMQECFDYIRSTAWFMDANFASIQKMTEAQNEAKAALAKASGEEVLRQVQEVIG